MPSIGDLVSEFQTRLAKLDDRGSAMLQSLAAIQSSFASVIGSVVKLGESLKQPPRILVQAWAEAGPSEGQIWLYVECCSDSGEPFAGEVRFVVRSLNNSNFDVLGPLTASVSIEDNAGVGVYRLLVSASPRAGHVGALLVEVVSGEMSSRVIVDCDRVFYRDIGALQIVVANEFIVGGSTSVTAIVYVAHRERQEIDFALHTSQPPLPSQQLKIVSAEEVVDNVWAIQLAPTKAAWNSLPALAIVRASDSATGRNESHAIAVRKKERFAVHLLNGGANKIGVIKIVQSILGVGLSAAMHLVESAPVELLTDSSHREAVDLVTQLKSAGASAELT